jgi:hypothetical protein
MSNGLVYWYRWLICKCDGYLGHSLCMNHNHRVWVLMDHPTVLDVQLFVYGHSGVESWNWQFYEDFMRRSYGGPKKKIRSEPQFYSSIFFFRPPSLFLFSFSSCLILDIPTLLLLYSSCKTGQVDMAKGGHVSPSWQGKIISLVYLKNNRSYKANMYNTV